MENVASIWSIYRKLIQNIECVAVYVFNENSLVNIEYQTEGDSDDYHGMYVNDSQSYDMITTRSIFI